MASQSNIKSGPRQVFSHIAKHFKDVDPVELAHDIELAIEECRVWDKLSDEALELFEQGLVESTAVATPRQPRCL